LFADFLAWTGWQAIGVFVSVIIGILTLWLTPKPKSKQDNQNLNETIQSAPAIDTVDGQAYNPSVHKNIVVFVAIIIGIIPIWMTLEPKSKQDNQNLNETIQSAPVIDTVDGQAYNPNVHKNIVTLVVYRYAVNGQKILGFTSFQNAQQYEQDHLNDQQAVQGDTYFYDNASTDPRGLGAKLPVKVGTNVPYFESIWNDVISSVDIHPQSKVSVYEKGNYTGPYLIFVNNGNSSSRWFLDLFRYNFPDDVDWNDRISSIKIW
jgi:hypothetical protein